MFLMSGLINKDIYLFLQGGLDEGKVLDYTQDTGSLNCQMILTVSLRSWKEGNEKVWDLFWLSVNNVIRYTAEFFHMEANWQQFL